MQTRPVNAQAPRMHAWRIESRQRLLFALAPSLLIAFDIAKSVCGDSAPIRTTRLTRRNQEASMPSNDQATTGQRPPKAPPLMVGPRHIPDVPTDPVYVQMSYDEFVNATPEPEPAVVVAQGGVHLTDEVEAFLYLTDRGRAVQETTLHELLRELGSNAMLASVRDMTFVARRLRDLGWTDHRTNKGGFRIVWHRPVADLSTIKAAPTHTDPILYTINDMKASEAFGFERGRCEGLGKVPQGFVVGLVLGAIAVLLLVGAFPDLLGPLLPQHMPEARQFPQGYTQR